MKDEKYGVGKKFKTNEGYLVEVVEKINNGRRKIKFENGYETMAKYYDIGEGRVKNPYHPSVYSVGYFGVGEYRASINYKQTPEYRIWANVLKRCYDEKNQERCPTYKGVTVCQEWHSFQNFAKWYNDNLPKIYGVKFHLDKDLLQQAVKNKIYSPDTCVFLPQEINKFLNNKQSSNTSGYIGVHRYKTHKKWIAQIMVFGEDKGRHLGRFLTLEQASQAYQKARAEQSEKVKDYLRSLNYLPEETIQLVK